MTVLENRFLTGFRAVESDAPGLVEENDGTIWVVDPDGTRHQLPGSGGSGCPYLTCEGDVATLAAGVVSLEGESQVVAFAAGAEVGQNPSVFVGVSSSEDPNRAYIEAGVSGAADEGSFGRIKALRSNGQGAEIELLAEEGGDSSYSLTGDKISFGNGVAPIERPTFDLSSGTAAQLAQMLADLGLIEVVA